MVISGTIGDHYDHENTKVLASGSLIDIINKINETLDELRK
jgi:hypothetical protein